MGFAQTIFLAFLLIAACVIALMVAIAQTARLAPIPQSAVEQRGYAIRRWWFRAVLAAIALALAITIPMFPYPKAAATAIHASYRVTAQQYGFVMPPNIRAGERVDFAVTSSDVNHGFGIYDPQGRLVAQVQAMPHYVNHLQVAFTQRGTYTVRCLEYCGIGHAYMRSQFEVK